MAEDRSVMESIGEGDKTGFEEYCNRLFNYCVCCIYC